MNSKVILAVLFLVSMFSSAELSHASHKTRLYDIIRKTVSKDSDTIILEVRPHEDSTTTTTTTVSSTTTTAETPVVIDKPEIIESEEEINIQTRESWDSGEENYFKWAALNRRPMESLAGRKRSIRKHKSTE